MLSEPLIRAAFNDLMCAAALVQEGSRLWVQFVSQAGMLGWVLEEENYAQNIETILKEIRELLKGKVTREV